MKPIARPFYRAALDALYHASVHSSKDRPSDPVQTVLSLDFAVEMLLKAILLNRGESIMASGNRSVGIFDAMKKIKSPTTYLDAASIEVLHEKRNNLQHFAGYMDTATVLDLYESTMRFASEAFDELGEKMPDELRLVTRLTEAAGGFDRFTLVYESEFLQRDVHAAGQVVVWAQGEANSSNLSVWAKEGNSPADRLTPPGQFEYMPRTDGRRVAAYRQSGGVVVYDLGSHARTIVSETGGPTDLQGDYVAVQGRDISGGLGGGISILNLKTAAWTTISQTGDSARFNGEEIFWQDLDGEKLVIWCRGIDVAEDDPRRVLAGSHPSPSGELLAWADWAPDPFVHVTTMSGEEILGGERGIFPSLYGRTLAYLQAEPDASKTKLIVQSVANAVEKVEFSGVGLPAGGGPVVVEDAVYFESKGNRNLNSIWKYQL